MKGFFAKRWHGIPIGIVSAALLVCMLAGSAVAGYGFFNAKIVATVEEAVYPSYGWGDDLVPYMLPIGAVPPQVVADPVKWSVDLGSLTKPATFTITKGGADASEFCVGEVLALLGKPVYCIKTTALGEPAHPLYFPLSSQLVPYVRKDSTLQ